MDYVELYCQVQPVDPWADLLIAELADIGFESFSEEPDGFKAYISACRYRAKAVSSLFEYNREPGPSKLSFEINRLGGKNWNAVWESNFEPITIGNQCHIRAPFHAPPGNILYDLIIEPKMSFGTGHHETTALVVEWLLDTNLKGKDVLDMGCGTGVLAILAAKMGAKKVTAIDNYLFAWENTRENAVRNQVLDMQVLHGDASLLSNMRFDVVIANITRNVLLEDMEAYLNVLRPGGMLFLSGFLFFDKDAIFARGDQLGLLSSGEKTLRDWVSVKMIKP